MARNLTLIHDSTLAKSYIERTSRNSVFSGACFALPFSGVFSLFDLIRNLTNIELCVG